ncbi:T9SS type A sorting domain-containing protein [Hymenobacter sp. DH14]|uniref:T9SS type A sorting domain-containing protein n=1 Tax=Hymenobacter cyanobacteriorum TaxID=2926463 RepID=A0A9X1VIC1_9BACT|nr:T9SS type A sorting domain-containing protein [Hymenobacter cyanobacteriorum]MCI1187490.1 T9SS type A sorting domain-containing protein [Hymenobacter cyanobacteriorum]
MKHIFSVNLLRQGLAVGLIGLFYSGSFYMAQMPHGSKQAAFIEQWLEGNEEEGDADGDRVFADRPDLALEQELELTRDPATGLVPRQRLLAAAQYNEKMLAAMAGQRPSAGVLSNATWTERGPSNVAGRVLGLLIDPTDPSGNTIWAGSAGGGLWKGTNATTSNIQWTNVNSFLTNLAVTTIAAGPASQPTVMYCGTGEGYFNSDAIQGAGIWKSTNNGSTWTQLASTNNINFAYVQKILVHPVTGDVYAATRNGLFRSQNGGSTWTAVLSNNVAPATATARVADIEIAADNTLFVAMGIFSTDGIYRSTTGDAGSWTKLNTLTGSGLPTTGYQRIELACAPSDANRIYALFQSSATGYPFLNIFRSMDKGNTWEALARPGATATNTTFDFTNGQGWYDLAAAVSPADPNALYVGGLDLWFTSDGGSATPTTITWDHESAWNTTTTSPYYVHADQHAIAFVPTTVAPANKAFFGSDGGVAYSADASISNANEPQFSQRNTNFNVTQFYALAVHPTNYNFFLAGAQDNGTQRFTATGVNSTTMVTGGDGGFCAIDQDNPAVQFTSYVYNQYRRSLNGGTSFTNFNISASLGSFINPFEYDSQANILYACHNTDTYLAWTNAGDPAATTATTINPSLGTGAGKVTHIAVSPLTRKRIYVGTNAGKVLLVDSAHTLTPIVRTLRTGTASTSVSCIAIDPANEKHLLVTYSNYGIVSVFETRDADATAPTWTSVEGALPDMPVRWALFDPRNTARAMLATEMGVYSTELLNGTSTVWTPASSGLAYTRVEMLRYRSGDQLVAAATHGRGLFTSDVFYTAGAGLASKPSAADLFTSAYPNPFSSELNLDLAPAAARTPTTAYLADALGRRVFSTTVQPANGALHLTVPTSVAPGNYTLVVSQGGRQTSRRVTKQ